MTLMALAWQTFVFRKKFAVTAFREISVFRKKNYQDKTVTLPYAFIVRFVRAYTRSLFVYSLCTINNCVHYVYYFLYAL